MHIVLAKLGQADAGDNEVKLMTKLAPAWVRTSNSLIFYRWSMAPAQTFNDKLDYICKVIA